MTKETYESLKATYLEFITELIKDFGGLSPAITVLGIRKEDQKNAVIHIPIPEHQMETEKGKDEFVDKIVPEIGAKIKESFEIHCVIWASEAWLRALPKDSDGKPTLPENWKDLPKKEVMFITIESEDDNDVIIMEIVRQGQQVNSNGQLTDHIELVPFTDYEKDNKPPNLEGRFNGLYKKFTGL
jgi:hypothetical protein